MRAAPPQLSRTGALVLTGWAILRRGAGLQKERSGSAAVAVAALAALGCTIYSADTNWRFAADYLDMAGTAERAGMFAAAELALFATALMARQNLATQGAPGMPGTLVWVITGVQVIPAYAESGPVGGTVRALVGPVLAAVLWHLAGRYLGRLPVSEALPNSDKEVVLLRDDVIKSMQDLPEHTYPSVEQLVRRHRDPEDSFDLGAFEFVHLPGGHAPMVDFVDNPWIGELPG